MMKHKTITVHIFGLALAMFYGCGSSGLNIPASTTTMTSAEAEVVANAIMEGGPATAGSEIFSSSDFASSIAQKLQLGQDTIPFNNQQLPELCTSGTAVLDGTISADFASEQSGKIAYDLKQTFNDCAVINGDGAVLDGAIDTKGNLSFSYSGDDTNFTFKLNVKGTALGSLAVNGIEAAAGTCGVGITSSGNITVSFSGGEPTVSGSVKNTGRVCEQSINQELSDEIWSDDV